MTAKEYLEQVYYMRLRIDQLGEEVQRLKDEVDSGLIGVGAFDYSAVRVQTSPKKSASYEKIIERLADTQARLEDVLCEYYEKRSEVILLLHQLEKPAHVRILHMRHLEFKKLGVISEELHYDWGYTRHLYGDALHAFGGIMRKNGLC